MKYFISKSKLIKKILLITLVFSFQQYTFSQEFESYNNNITFYSEAPLENIEAISQKVYCYLNVQTGAVNAMVMIKSFEFDKQLMKEHFNEQYMESHKYPNATFEGRVSDLEKLKTRKSDTYKTVGDLYIHGVTHPIEVMVNLSFEENLITGRSEFTVETADYKIKIPRFVIKNIAEEIDITIDFKIQ